MNTLRNSKLTLITILAALTMPLWSAAPALAHCDSEDGPVIPLIRTALDSGEITPLLKWIAAEDEPEIKALFTQVRAVRDQSDTARVLADRLFTETFIRIHRASEGAPFTGIKDAGQIPPIFASLDHALAEGRVEPLADRIAAKVREAIVARFDKALQLQGHSEHSVDAGREYVRAYVTYMHFVEGLHGYLEESADGGRGHEQDGHGH